jgi:hypothetical protein
VIRAILENLRHRVRVLRSVMREIHKHDMDPLWLVARDRFLARHSRCAGCGGSRRRQVHHIRPPNFRQDELHNDLLVDESNLIVLCAGAMECHLRLGHGGNYDYYNPWVAIDAARTLLHPDERQKVEMKALFNRMPNEGKRGR